MPGALVVSTYEYVFLTVTIQESSFIDRLYVAADKGKGEGEVQTLIYTHIHMYTNIARAFAHTYKYV